MPVLPEVESMMVFPGASLPLLMPSWIILSAGRSFAEHAADHRQRDAGIARGGVDDGLPRRELAALDALLDHLERRSVFHRAAGVEAFELRENFHSRGDAFGDFADLDEGSVTDEIEDGMDDLRLSEPFGGDPARCGRMSHKDIGGYYPPAIAGTIEMLSPSFSEVSRCCKHRMSSPLT